MEITSSAVGSLDRDMLIRWYQRNRKRSEELFSLIDPSVYYRNPIPLRHPFVFYEGHLPTFSFLTLNERALHETPLDPIREKLFERGIDPSSLTDAQRHARQDWPNRDEVQAFAQACDERVIAAFRSAQLVNDDNPCLVRGESAFTILEHEQMHHETLLYIIHQLDPTQKRFPSGYAASDPSREARPPKNEFLAIAAGHATLGQNHGDFPFGWDNEFAKHTVDVPAFLLQRYPITNGDWLEFARAGGPVPAFWIDRHGTWYLQGAFEHFPLPLAWPVYVSHDQAQAYAAWKDARLPTEAEYHRAVLGTPDNAGNFDFMRYDPQPVDAHPAGASSSGIEDLVGNGWEWTGTPFGPFPGFTPMASYPRYSVDFFDGKHFVMKGASPVTAKELVRRSFRNWFYGDYPYMYAKFRLAREGS